MPRRPQQRLHLESLEQRELLAVDTVAICSVDDIFQAIQRDDVAFDLNEDGQMDLRDASFLVEEVFATRWGDSDLDGEVNFNDFLNLSSNFGRRDATFADGDADGDGGVSFSDFLSLSANFGFDNNQRTMLDIKDGTRWLPNRTTFDMMSHVEDVPGAAGIREVKFVVDLAFGDIHFANQNRYQYHYTFTRNALGYQGDTFQFNQETYFTPNRRFVAGSVLAHDNFEADGVTGLFSVEFWPTDPVGANHVIYTMAKVQEAMPFAEGRLAYHPSSETQRELYASETALFENAQTPVISTEQLFGSQKFAALNPGVAFGRLRVVNGTDGIPLTARDLVIFENIPNDLTHVAGVITVQPQTPLSHVNLRAKQNDTPNAYIRDALTDPTFQSLIGRNVRFEVVNGTYSIRLASAAEVDEHFASIRPEQTQFPARDLTRESIVPLSSLRTADQIAFGAKAANLGELSLILPDEQVPDGLAIPFALYDQFMKANGFYEEARAMLATAEFQAEPAVRENQLKTFRKKIENGAVPADIKAKLDQALLDLRAVHGQDQPIRARSSTNNEDLVGFTGAGLYDSKTHRPDEGALDKTVREVWASLWTFRAFEERDFWRIDHFQAAMGVALHPNFDLEQANGVAVTKNIYDPNWEGYYVNVQVGEDLVTNPEGNVTPDEFLVSAIGPNREWETQYIRHSNLTQDGSDVMSEAHIAELVAAMQTIQRHFRQVYNALGDRAFAMDIEFKVDADGQLVIKQARPWVD